MNNVDNTLETRGQVYGNFELGVTAIGDIMSILNNLHQDKNDVPLSPKDFQTINFLVIKLVRLGATPNHIDSWHDIQGYGKLGEDMYRRNELVGHIPQVEVHNE